MQSARGPAPGPAAREAARLFSVWVDCIGVKPVSCFVGGSGRGEVLQKGKEIPSAVLKMEIRNFISSGSEEATVLGFLLLCSPGVVLLRFEKSDSSGN